MSLIQSFSNAASVVTVGGIPVRAVTQVDALGNPLISGGTTTAAVAADTSSATVVKASPGRLGRVLITASGSGSVVIYDNASAASGTVIGITPANPAVGTTYDFEMPAAFGITVAGSSTLPGITVSFY